ncbi:PREDICTED: uncharacterized protein LOC104603796 isoform X2 [Nelumbo nucifera]|uniref:Inner membrane localized protein n=2 Tax=Nelumbo nucifera TaxID=4432 RepID=A0A822ZJF8_NELNU|nr:PREDICTED: uncharacterized protein LOC104603796 isoform X2 [Nelumbo nucifera]DAD41858.1 TPA_asm: hypothetical protein HUJ06_016181 [Nelumbo nucifera]
MTTLGNAFVSTSNSQTQLSSSGFTLKSAEKCLVKINSTNLSFSSVPQRKAKFPTYKRSLTVQAGYSGDGGKTSSASSFIGGFVLGGIVVGMLGCVYAPQISKALAGADRKDLMKKLPKFIYNEEKALETRKILAEKIEQLNSAIDDVSVQLRAEDAPNGAAVGSDEIEAAI